LVKKAEGILGVNKCCYFIKSYLLFIHEQVHLWQIILYISNAKAIFSISNTINY
jgi:hypothetical protein